MFHYEFVGDNYPQFSGFIGNVPGASLNVRQPGQLGIIQVFIGDVNPLD